MIIHANGFQSLETGEASPKETNEAVHNSRIYNSFSDCSTKATECLSNTGRRIHDWATNPRTQAPFICITFAVLCGTISITCGALYNNCLQTNSTSCSQITSTSHCHIKKNHPCEVYTTSRKDDLLAASAIFAVVSTISIGCGIFILRNR